MNHLPLNVSYKHIE